MGAISTYQFPITKEPHLATVRDKVRNSGLTSVRFIDEDNLVCCDFNEKMTYLARVAGGELTILDSHPTTIADGTPVETDLMDLSGDRFAVSNFYQGSVSFYRIENGKIVFEREINHNDFKNLHGVRYVPGDERYMWLTYCGVHNRCHQIIDTEDGRLVHNFETDQQCQDVAFVGDFAVVFARTNHISAGVKKPGLFSKKRRMFATAYVYRMPADIGTEPPSLVSEWTGKGHIDACKEYQGKIYAANQYLDRVDVFSVSPAGKLSLDGFIKGMGMPHGLDVWHGKLAVTNYDDQTLRMTRI